MQANSHKRGASGMLFMNHCSLLPVAKSRSRLLIVVTLLLPACAEWPALPAAPAEPVISDCQRLLHEMDRQVEAHGVADAGTSRIPGFPELRIDRFLASFATDQLGADAFAAWLERLRQLDMTARRIEWRNLPLEAAAALTRDFGPNIAVKLEACSQQLGAHTLASANRRGLLISAIEPPDAYSTWQRLFGVYFLSRWAIVEGVRRGQREMREPFIQADQLPDSWRLLRYAPPATAAIDATEIAKILDQSARNPLRIPQPSTEQLSRLFVSLAPFWIIDTANTNDRIGAAAIDAEQNALVDTGKPVVYSLASHTRFGDQVLLQLNYLIWFPAREAESWLDIYAGRFDGLIWRVTLGMDGKPLAYDSIHACGCYYQIFPRNGFKIVQPQDGSEPILSPMPIADLHLGEHLAIRLASRTHYILGISAEHALPGAIEYDWLDYDQLRSLPMANGRQRSLFSANGLLQGSERLERFVLWPMGVPSPGAMRQWGTHAVAFFGKRHFDDPRLIENLLRPAWE